MATLEDGGPVSFSIDGDDFEVGRDGAMDWTLPDPSRHISSRHFEVNFRKGAYFLTDCSTNGTYRHGESNRISSPLQIYDGDKFTVGKYVIVVEMGGGAPAAVGAAPGAGFDNGFGGGFGGPPAGAPAPGGGDPWSVGGSGPAAIPVNDLIPDRAPRRDSFDSDFIDTPLGAPGGAPAMAPAPAPPASGGGIGSAIGAAPGMAPPPQVGGAPASIPPSPGFGAAPAAAPLAAGPAAADVEAFIAQICQGAGLSPDTFRGTDTSRLGLEIGQVLRNATEAVMALLQARAAAKTFVKSSSRTMIGATDNSPMKFLPDATQALDAMFFHKRPGFMDGVAAFRDGLGEVQQHQTAVYAAIQPALARLLEDLSPEAIEQKSEAGLMSSKKGAKWDTYVARWDAKTHPYENGMLDVFLAYFAEAYDDASKK